MKRPKQFKGTRCRLCGLVALIVCFPERSGLIQLRRKNRG